MPRYHPLNPGIFVGPTGFVALPIFGSSKKKKPTPKMSFTPETTGEEVVKAYPDKVIGKTFIITGASTRSVGQQTALALARGSPNHLILLSRTESKVLPVIEQITAMDSSISVRFIKMDLGSQASVRAAAAEILKTVPHIDALINNAGVMAVPYELTPEGIEMQFGINHIGHFLLTNLLIPRMRPGSRIVNVSSAGHSMSGVRFDDVNFANGADYDMWDAYGQSKSANILFAIALAGRLAKKGIQAFSLHPGFTAGESELATHLVDPDWAEILKKFNGYPIPRDKTMPQACSTQVAAAIDPYLASYSGAYLEDCKASNPAPCANDAADAEKLWVLSELLVGQRFSY